MPYPSYHLSSIMNCCLYWVSQKRNNLYRFLPEKNLCLKDCRVTLNKTQHCFCCHQVCSGYSKIRIRLKRETDSTHPCKVCFIHNSKCKSVFIFIVFNLKFQICTLAGFEVISSNPSYTYSGGVPNHDDLHIHVTSPIIIKL